MAEAAVVQSITETLLQQAAVVGALRLRSLTWFRGKYYPQLLLGLVVPLSLTAHKLTATLAALQALVLL
jgi:hypothetical protein